MKYLILIFLPIAFLALFYPFFPSVQYSIAKPGRPVLNLYSLGITKDNRLYIPEILINTKIVEGNDESALSKGAWHLPYTGSPLSGNMVIGGHRFEYLPPNNTTFYNLDKLKIGDPIYVSWQGKVYKYVVNKVTVTNPDDLSIENDTPNPTLTLFTCTPLWTAAYRLVVISNIDPSFHL